MLQNIVWHFETKLVKSANDYWVDTLSSLNPFHGAPNPSEVEVDYTSNPVIIK